jgi:hypothetical protein
MNIDLNKLISPELVERIQGAGLHKLAAAVHEVETGREVPGGEFTMPVAIQVLGERIFEKRATYQHIAKGLAAYRSLTSKEG